jgi:uncharacterized protein
LKIHLPTYLPGIHAIEESLEPVSLDLDTERFSEQITAKLMLDRHDPYLQFQFDLRTFIFLDCDRCAESYREELHAQTGMMYVLGHHAKAIDADDPGITYLPAGTMDLDLTTDLRDFLLLALPSKFLCKEDCRGLCADCGANLNLQSCQCQQS